MTPETARKILDARDAFIVQKPGGDLGLIGEKVLAARDALVREDLTDDIGMARERISASNDALVGGDYAEAWHQLYAIADPKFGKFDPWEELEKFAAQS